jgi:uncharacterized membrane protein YozB (DUF420 family)
MKNMKTKIIAVLEYIYGLGIMLSLFVGALSFLGYLVAIIVGGPTAVEICKVIYKKIYPVIIYVASVSVLLGLVKMYIAGEKSLAPDKKKKVVKETVKEEAVLNEAKNQENEQV